MFESRIAIVLQRFRVLLHLLFWCSFFVYEWFVWEMVDGEFRQRLVISLIEFPAKLAAAYFTLYVLIDKLLMRKKYGLFLISLLVSMAVFGIVSRMLSYYITYPLYYPDGLDIPLLFLPKILIAIFGIYSVVAIVASFHLIRLWYRHYQAAQELLFTAQKLERENLEAELKLLKSQINPHFLFNTLNNLYTLTLNSSEKAPETVQKLSQIMSYMLYDSNQVRVPLSKEIEYIENYVALEKIRYAERLDVELHVYNDVSGITVAPLLILPFVENCFKHGVSRHIHHSWIRIYIALREEVLTIKVGNSKPRDGNQETGHVSGIGLKNIQRRLELLYKDNYTLKFFDEEEEFLVVLKIALQPGALQHVFVPDTLEEIED
jgi:sensor histidine kinase YesM